MTRRICRNETCRQEFTPSRSSQLYCDPLCQMRQNQRLYKRKDRVRERRKILDQARREATCHQ